MSYARWGPDSDVFVWMCPGEGWITWTEADPLPSVDDSAGACLARLRRLREAGMRVPDFAITRLEEEMRA